MCSNRARRISSAASKTVDLPSLIFGARVTETPLVLSVDIFERLTDFLLSISDLSTDVNCLPKIVEIHFVRCLARDKYKICLLERKGPYIVSYPVCSLFVFSFQPFCFQGKIGEL